MLRIALSSVMVDDQARAHAFYVDVLGFELRRDIPFDGGRWLTVTASGAPDVELLLEPAGFEFARTYQRALREAGIPINAFAVEDVQRTFEALRARGVVFQSPPVQIAGQTIAVLDDTCGNWIQIYQDDGAV
ncbi:MAG: VOC family protein [Luteimonas sp.]